MNAATAVVLSSFAIGVGGVCTYLVLGGPESRRAEASETEVVRDDRADLEASIRGLQDSIDELERQLATAQAGPRTAARINQADIERAVAAYFEQNGPAALVADAEELDEPTLGSAEDYVAALLESGTIESTELWEKIVAAGLAEEVLALYEAAAEANPNDPEAQLALGEAYLGLTQQHAGSPTAGKYATLADQALDAALAADPQHWEARYTKATALSFWPPVFGKQTAAIQQFETLVEQQKGLTPESHHASTHLLLGNMYQQTGQMDKAIAAWQAGLQMFPDNADLATQIALASSGNGGGGY